MTDVISDLYRMADTVAANTETHEVLIRAAAVIQEGMGVISQANVTMDSLEDQIEQREARISELKAALEERHRHHLKLELRCRELEAEKRTFKDGNKQND